MSEEQSLWDTVTDYVTYKASLNNRQASEWQKNRAAFRKCWQADCTSAREWLREQVWLFVEQVHKEKQESFNDYFEGGLENCLEGKAPARASGHELPQMPSELRPLAQDQIFIQPDVTAALRKAINAAFTPREQRTWKTIQGEKQKAAKQYFSWHAKKHWGGFLTGEEMVRFLKSPAIALLSREQIEMHKIDIRTHRAQVVREKCYKTSNDLYHIAVQVWPSPGTPPIICHVDRNPATAQVFNPSFAGPEAGSNNAARTLEFLVTGSTYAECAMWFYENVVTWEGWITHAYRDTLLWELAVMSQGLHDCLNWPFPEACAYVATGQQPEHLDAVNYDGRYTMFPSGLDKLELSIAPHVSPETVKNIYRLLWMQYHGDNQPRRTRNRQKTPFTAKVHAFVERNKQNKGIVGDLTRQQQREIYAEWKRLQEEEPAPLAKRFWEIYRRGQE